MPVPRERPPLPPDIEDHRDERWGRDITRQVQTPIQAEHFVERNGFAACMTDSRRPGPSLYIAVCGRRDAVMPRNVQTDEEASLTWLLKDEVIRRGRVYYAKLARGKAFFVAPRMIPYFNAIWGLKKADEPRRLGKEAQAILRVLRREWEMGTSDLRDESGIADRVKFTRAMDELQAAMVVLPSEVLYKPKFTYIWTLGVGAIPGCAAQARGAIDGRQGGGTLLSQRRGDDRAGRTGARHRPVARRGRPWQSRARGRGLRRHALARNLSAGGPAYVAAGLLDPPHTCSISRSSTASSISSIATSLSWALSVGPTHLIGRHRRSFQTITGLRSSFSSVTTTVRRSMVP